MLFFHSPSVSFCFLRFFALLFAHRFRHLFQLYVFTTAEFLVLSRYKRYVMVYHSSL